MNANIFAKANQIIQASDAAYLGVIDEDGGPHVSTVSAIRPESLFEAYFATGMEANKVRRLRRDKRASVCYRADGNNITLAGEAEILTDQATKSRCWMEWFIHHFPGGETDPDYVVIKFTTKRASLWIDNEGAAFTIDELLAAQSRCGLLCGFCAYRQSHGCGGCAETDGHPFHGACPVAACCQERGYAHCGECGDLPGECSAAGCDHRDYAHCADCGHVSCGKLYAYSCADSEHGDNPPGARIAVCRAWAAGRTR